LTRTFAELSAVHTARVETIASATLTVETAGEGFFEITREVTRFLDEVKARDGVVLLYLRHTSASLVIQENADPDVQTDLVTALERIAPDTAGWIHDSEGPDDMPSHIKAMINGVSLHVPVTAGKMALGTWQGIYVAEHRARPHRREITIQFIGACGPG
jgi:secondary thiamine-phosphate synthase enzyme